MKWKRFILDIAFTFSTKIKFGRYGLPKHHAQAISLVWGSLRLTSTTMSESMWPLLGEGRGFGGWGHHNTSSIHYLFKPPNPSWIHTPLTYKFPAIPEKLQSRKEFQTLTQLAQPPNVSNYPGQSVIPVWPTKVHFRSNISKIKDTSVTTLLSTYTRPLLAQPHFPFLKLLKYLAQHICHTNWCCNQIALITTNNHFGRDCNRGTVSQRIR